MPDTGNFPLMATNMKALQGPLFGEGDLGDSDLCLAVGGILFIRVVMLSLPEEKLRTELSCWHMNN